MTCYRDMTFCIAACAYTPCYHKLTPEVEEAAARWWGSSNAPIAVSDYSDTCPDYKELPCSSDTSETPTQP